MNVEKIQIAPSILAADFAHLQKDCQRVLDAGADMLHVDVMDGHFVPNISIGVPVLESLRKAFPNVFLDVHLMMTNPLQYVGAFAKAGASLIGFHVEVEEDIQQIIDEIHSAGCEAGITIKPATQAEEIYPYLKTVEQVLVMSVEPGFGGQAFMDNSLLKIEKIKKQAMQQNLTNLKIQVDGGINPQTAKQVLKAGANVLVAGSAVYGADNPQQIMEQMRQR